MKTETYDVANEAEYDKLVRVLTELFEDRWWIVEVEYRYEREKWWHLMPLKIPTKIIAEFDV